MGVDASREDKGAVRFIISTSEDGKHWIERKKQRYYMEIHFHLLKIKEKFIKKQGVFNL